LEPGLFRAGFVGLAHLNGSFLARDVSIV
jgi:hypothetical protein